MPDLGSHSSRNRGSQLVRKRMALSRVLVLAGLMSFLTGLTVQPRILEATEHSLVLHMMLEHLLFFSIGAISVLFAESSLGLLVSLGKSGIDGVGKIAGTIWPVWARIIRGIFAAKRYGFVWLSAAIALLAFWHLPPIFDLASTVASVHVAQHFSFVLVGAAGFMALRILGEPVKILLLIIIIGMMGFTGLLFSVLTVPVFSAYPLADHHVTGTIMIIISIVLLIVGLPAFLIQRAIFHVRSTGK